ncbi:MAG: hypothetical protein GXP22_01735 [Gammaproteobacteria bacterium]|nr:hypothetical protein [Gammaproteobacteria bacterium]
MNQLLSLVESPSHPDFSSLYQRLDIQQTRHNSSRKAMGALKKTKPDIVVAEFFYGFGNNYAGVNVCNLDVFLSSLQKYAPDARVIILVSRQEQQYVSLLQELFPIHAILAHPVTEQQMEEKLVRANSTEWCAVRTLHER